MRLPAVLAALAVTAVATAGVLVAGLRAPEPAPPAPLTHDAYVWQRAWTGAVSRAVAAAPADLAALRVLMVEVPAAPVGAATSDDDAPMSDGATPIWPAVDLEALAGAGRPIIAVVRIDGRRVPAALALDDVIARTARWRAAGVDVRGLEIDHDCATAALDDYAVWLARRRPPAPLRWSITALPTWAGSPALPRVAAAVDELVVQVHAVRAPHVFEPAEARRGLEAFAAAVPGADLRVALPTYRVNLGGTVAAAGPDEVGGFVRALERAPIAGVGGVVWFRLPVEGDDTAWPTSTLVAAIRGDAAPAPRATVELVTRAPGVHDLVLVNAGAEPAPWPALSLAGALDAADLIGGYHAARAHRWEPPARDVAPGARIVVGWATGKDLRVTAD